MTEKIRYRKREYRGYGKYVTKFVKRNDIIRYLKKYNPTATKAQIRKMVNSRRVLIDKYGRVKKK